MNEADWLNCSRPTPMLEFLRGKLSGRKARLFALACCRTVWPLISKEFREAITVAEAHADGIASDAELGAVVSIIHRARRRKNLLDRAIYDAVRSCGNADLVVEQIARVVASVAAPNPSPTLVITVSAGQVAREEIPPNADRLLWNAAFAAHLQLESSILRDIVGPAPFRTIIPEAGVLSWQIVKLAEGIYNERAFYRLVTLADDLEEAGCKDAEMLNHCREEQSHTRGCWVLDSILGKS